MTLSGQLDEVVYLGATAKLVVRLAGGAEAIVRTAVERWTSSASIGSRVRLQWNTHDAVLLPAGTGDSGRSGSGSSK